MQSEYTEAKGINIYIYILCRKVYIGGYIVLLINLLKACARETTRGLSARRGAVVGVVFPLRRIYISSCYLLVQPVPRRCIISDRDI